MYEANESMHHRMVESAPVSEDHLFLFIDLTDDRGWADLESALPEGAADDVTGNVV